MPAPYAISNSEKVGQAWAYYGAGAGLIDLTTVAGKPQRCARRIVPFATGNFTVCKGSDGVDVPVTGFPAGYIHDAHVSSINCSVAFCAFW